MKVLVIGAGMYMPRGEELGDSVPCFLRWRRHRSALRIGGVTICSTSEHGQADVERATTEINRRLGTALKVEHRVLESFLPTGARSANFDCAIVSVPDHLHFEMGRRVLDAGLHCLMVKPFVPTVF